MPQKDNLGIVIFDDINGVYQRDLRKSYAENFRLISKLIDGLNTWKENLTIPAETPIATTEIPGKVMPDGDTILIMEDGTIKAAVKVALATVDAPGIVAPDGDTILVDENGKIRAAVKVNIATTEAAGIVKPDGESIKVNEDGTIRASIPESYTKEQVDQMLSDISALLMTDADLELLCAATNSLMGEENTYTGMGANIVAVNALAEDILM